MFPPPRCRRNPLLKMEIKIHPCYHIFEPHMCCLQQHSPHTQYRAIRFIMLYNFVRKILDSNIYIELFDERIYIRITEYTPIYIELAFLLVAKYLPNMKLIEHED